MSDGLLRKNRQLKTLSELSVLVDSTLVGYISGTDGNAA